MAIRLGASAIGAMRLGASTVPKAYLGSTEVYSAGGLAPQAIIGNSTNFLTIPDDPIFTATTGWTACLWVKTNSQAQGRVSEGFFGQSANANLSWTMHTLSTVDSRIYCSFSELGSVATTCNPLTPGGFGGQIWKHLVLQYNGATPVLRGKLNDGSWDNGALTPAATMFNSTEIVRIGAENGGTNPFRSSTRLAHVVWANSVLSDADITQIYNARDAASMPAGVDLYFDFSDFDGVSTVAQIGGLTATVNAASLLFDGDVP